MFCLCLFCLASNFIKKYCQALEALRMPRDDHFDPARFETARALLTLSASMEFKRANTLRLYICFCGWGEPRNAALSAQLIADMPSDDPVSVLFFYYMWSVLPSTLFPCPKLDDCLVADKRLQAEREASGDDDVFATWVHLRFYQLTGRVDAALRQDMELAVRGFMPAINSVAINSDIHLHLAPQHYMPQLRRLPQVGFPPGAANYAIYLQFSDPYAAFKLHEEVVARYAYPKSISALAQCYADGTGTAPADYELGARLLREAIDRTPSDVVLYEALSRLLLAHGAEDERAEGTQWLIKAADAGFATAMVGVARWYALGSSRVMKSLDTATLYLRRAAELGNAVAIERLGSMSRETDATGAMAYYERAVELGNSTAMSILAQWLLEDPLISKQNLLRSIELLQRAAKLGQPLAFFPLMHGAFSGWGGKMTPDLRAAVAYGHAGVVRTNSAPLTAMLGVLLSENTPYRDGQKVLMLLRMALQHDRNIEPQWRRVSTACAAAFGMEFLAPVL